MIQRNKRNFVILSQLLPTKPNVICLFGNLFNILPRQLFSFPVIVGHHKNCLDNFISRQFYLLNPLPVAVLIISGTGQIFGISFANQYVEEHALSTAPWSPYIGVKYFMCWV